LYLFDLRKGVNMKRWYRSRGDQKLGGVIGGLGEYLNMDANLLRLLTILVCLFTGILPVLITYFVAWAILPQEPVEEQTPSS
jgi:phage shock protein PspC (stress-responsive transcriptional regulator)